LSRAFHHFAMNKDTGVSLQQQSSTYLASSTLSMRCLNLVLMRSNQLFWKLVGSMRKGKLSFRPNGTHGFRIG